MRSPYTPEQVDRGLRVLAEHNGSGHNAAKALKKNGWKIARSTLERWREEDPARYAQIREEELPKIRARAGEWHMAVSERAVEMVGDALDKLQEELPELKGREIADALLKLSTVSGIHTDKAQNLSGMPSAIVEHRSMQDLLRGLRRRGVIDLPASAVVEERPELTNGSKPDPDSPQNAGRDVEPAGDQASREPSAARRPDPEGD